MAEAQAQIPAYLGTGRRKTSVARVRMMVGSGKIMVNNRPFETYFPIENLRMLATEPLNATQNASRYDLNVNVKGGGPSGQAGAVRHGIARAPPVRRRDLASGAAVARLPDARSAHEGT